MAPKSIPPAPSSLEFQDGISDCSQNLSCGILGTPPTQCFPNWVTSTFPQNLFFLPKCLFWFTALLCSCCPTEKPGVSLISVPPSVSHPLSPNPKAQPCISSGHCYFLNPTQVSTSSPSTDTPSVQVLILFYLNYLMGIQWSSHLPYGAMTNNQSSSWLPELPCQWKTPLTTSHPSVSLSPELSPCVQGHILCLTSLHTSNTRRTDLSPHDLSFHTSIPLHKPESCSLGTCPASLHHYPNKHPLLDLQKMKPPLRVFLLDPSSSQISLVPRTCILIQVFLGLGSLEIQWKTVRESLLFLLLPTKVRHWDKHSVGGCF